MKKVAIIDDEKLAIEELKYLLKDYAYLDICGHAQTMEEAVQLIDATKPDLIFLDVQLRNVTAFDVLKQIQTEARIIFATAYDTYAIRAFEVNALYYLLKPIHPERLKQSLERFMQGQPPEPPVHKTYDYHDKVVVNHYNSYHIVNISDIKAITADGDYSYLITGSGHKHIFVKSLKEWELMLPTAYFTRIHRSCIINMQYVKHIEKWFSNTCRIYLEGLTDPFTMSQRHTAAFRKQYKR